MERKSKIDTNNKRGNWNHFEISRTIPEQHNANARHQGATANSHTGHCTHTAGSADVKLLRICHV
jgi:hypothetical protein